MASKLTILLQGASLSGKSQIVCWHTTNQANANTLQTIEETHEFLENFQGRKVLVEILDTGGDPNYVSLLEDWVSRANAQLLVINLEDKTSVDYLKEHHQTLTGGSVLGRVVVGNLPSGKQENRVVSKDETTELVGCFGPQALYLETNTRTGEGIHEVFLTLMGTVYNTLSRRVEAKANTEMTVHVGPIDKDTEIFQLKTRQQELEAKLAAQEANFSLRLQSLEKQLLEVSAAYHKLQEQALNARLEALETHLKDRLTYQVDEQALSKPVKGDVETETPVKSKLVKHAGESVKQGLFTSLNSAT